MPFNNRKLNSNRLCGK